MGHVFQILYFATLTLLGPLTLGAQAPTGATFLLRPLAPHVRVMTWDIQIERVNYYQDECSEYANQLLKKAWAAQPLNTRENNADPAKAESLYEQVIKDSPKCGRANSLLVTLLIRSRNYEKANEYNEAFLRLYPKDPSALVNKANLISILEKDHPRALEIKMSLLRFPEYNDNGRVLYSIAGTYSLMNKLDESLQYLKLALSLNKGWGNKWNAQVDSDFENLRKDNRFWTLVKQR